MAQFVRFLILGIVEASLVYFTCQSNQPLHKRKLYNCWFIMAMIANLDGHVKAIA